MECKKNIKAVVVDDAAFMRKALVDIISRSEDIEVVGIARHGKEALEAIKTFKPDVVTLDVDMPVMDGLTTIKHIMVKNPLPVVMVSGLADHSEITFEALRLGAVDFFPKPSGTVSDDIFEKGEELIRVLKLASGINPRIIKRALKPRQGNHGNPKGRHAAPKGVLIVVALQGAASSFIRLLSAVSPLHDLSILCIQDMSPLVLGCCARELNTTIACSALFDHDSLLKSGHCFLLRDRFLPALTIDEQGSVFLINEERSGRMHRFLQDASKIFGENICVCILGGPALEDIQPLDEIRKAGGKIIALSPERCACGEFSRTAAREFMAEILDSEQAVWAKIRAFSRRVMLKQASKRK